MNSAELASAEIGLPARDHFFLNKSPRFLVALLRLSVDPLPALLSRSALPFLPRSATAYSAAGVAACITSLSTFAATSAAAMPSGPVRRVVRCGYGRVPVA